MLLLRSISRHDGHRREDRRGYARWAEFWVSSSGRRPLRPRSPSVAGAPEPGDSGRVADDIDIQHRIKGLIDEEHGLRERLSSGDISVEEENQRLRSIEVELDQCWDLLRQRRARREFGENPNDAQVRDASTVENYLG
jgi:hypothetical protein